MHRTTNHKSSANRIVKSIASPFCGRERGFSSFIFVLVLLALGSIVIVPLLGYMITGTKSGATYERKTTELYSADAGVEYAIWWLQHGLLEVGGGFLGTKELTKDKNGGPLRINNDDVTVTIKNESDEIGVGTVYRIVSKAEDIPTGSATTVVSLVTPDIRFGSRVLSNAVSALGDIDIGHGDVWGDVQCAGTFTLQPGLNVYGDVWCGNLNNKGVIHGSASYDNLTSYGTIIEGGTPDVTPPPLVEDWPTVDELDFFYDEGLTLPVLPLAVKNKVMTQGGPGTLGPGKTGSYTPNKLPGEDLINTPIGLTINAGGTKAVPKVVKLTGTVLVTGDLIIAGFTTVNLNGQAIYVRGAINVSTSANISGSGTIIALGSKDPTKPGITFMPNMVVGGAGESSIIVHDNGTLSTWSVMNNPDLSMADLNDVWGSASDSVYAVGNAGKLLRYYNGSLGLGWYYYDVAVPGAPWSDPSLNLAAANPSYRNLNGIWGSSSDNVFVVGDLGTILHFNGSGWQKIGDIPTAANLRGIWGDPSVGIYVVGDLGTILHSSDGGLKWDKIPVGTLEGLWGVHGIVSGTKVEVVAVGTGGTIMHYRGSSWEVEHSPTLTMMDLRDVWGFSDATGVTFYAVGRAANLTSTILQYHSATGKWGKMNSPSGADMNDVWGIQSGGGTYVFAAGSDGIILRMQNGVDWVPMTNPSTYSLNAVWGTSPTDVFAVGEPKNNFVFIMCVYGEAKVQPGGVFLGSVAGNGAVDLQPGASLRSPSIADDLSFPQYRWIRLDTYVIR